MTARNSIQGIIANKPMSAFQVFVVLMCFILNMNDGIDVLVVSYTGSEMLLEWGLTKAQQGYIFSAGLLGMALGCLFIAPLADRIGRRKLFILAIAIDTVGLFLSSLVNDYWQLLCLRFITGLGIGALIPTLATIASEFSNNKRKDLSVAFVQAGWPLGAIGMGFFTAWAVPEFGWRFAFLTAGIISAVMLIMVITFLPESMDFLHINQPKNALHKINKTLSKIGHDKIQHLAASKTLQKPSLRSLFTSEYKVSTIALWIGIFFGFMTLYTLISWVPTIAKDSGMPFKMATYVGTVLNVGAFIGSTFIGWIAAKYKIRKLVSAFLFAAFAVLVIYGSVPLTTAVVFILTFLMGIFVQGGFNGYYPVSTRIYESEVRATGTGAAVGIGRFGAIAGPAIFGILSDMKLSVPTLFLLFSIPLVISGIAAYLLPSKNLK
jgi:MFS transporter, AAHS family, 4-hydroxybenzoate transporter